MSFIKSFTGFQEGEWFIVCYLDTSSRSTDTSFSCYSVASSSSLGHRQLTGFSQTLFGD